MWDLEVSYQQAFAPRVRDGTRCGLRNSVLTDQAAGSEGELVKPHRFVATALIHMLNCCKIVWT